MLLAFLIYGPWMQFIMLCMQAEATQALRLINEQTRPAIWTQNLGSDPWNHFVISKFFSSFQFIALKLQLIFRNVFYYCPLSVYCHGSSYVIVKVSIFYTTIFRILRSATIEFLGTNYLYFSCHFISVMQWLISYDNVHAFALQKLTAGFTICCCRRLS